MKIRILLFAVLILFITNYLLYSKINITGKISGYDGKALSNSSVSLISYKSVADTLIIKADSEGNYTLSAEAEDIVILIFSGTNHIDLPYSIITIGLKKNSFELNVKLAPEYNSVSNSDIYNPEITSNDKNIGHYIKMNSTVEEMQLEMDKKRNTAMQRNDSNLYISAKKNIISKYNDLINNEKNIPVKLLLELNYVYIAGDGMRIADAKDILLMKYVNDLFVMIKPSSQIWDIMPVVPFLVALFQNNIFESEYIDKIFKTNPSNNLKENLYYNLTMYSFETNNEAQGKKYIERYLKEFPKSSLAKTLFNKYMKEKIIKVGNIIPDFTLTNLDNPKDIITREKLKGKYVLIDFWGTWCGPCLREMRGLDTAYKLFKENNFTIFSIALDESIDKVKNFRKNKWPMPWLNAFAENYFDDEAVQLFEVIGIPKPILIDPVGRILALDMELRGENLEKTLRKYLK